MKIYKITNLINNKIYIGQTNGNNKKYFGGGDNLKKTIKKYGKYNFKMETIVEGNFNQFLIDELERHYIRLYNSTNRKLGYNIQEGGNVGNYIYIRTPEIREKIRKKLKNQVISKETKDKISKSNMGKPKTKGFTGLKCSEKHKKKISDFHSIPITQYNLYGEIIKEWKNQSLAAKELNINQGNLNACLKNRQKSAKGYIWKYK